MRYIIIPLLIMLYIYWSYISIKDIIKYSNRQWEGYTIIYINFHTIILLFTIIISIIYYW
jgi:hypothetical protein